MRLERLRNCAQVNNLSELYRGSTSGILAHSSNNNQPTTLIPSLQFVWPFSSNLRVIEEYYKVEFYVGVYVASGVYA